MMISLKNSEDYNGFKISTRGILKYLLFLVFLFSCTALLATSNYYNEKDTTSHSNLHKSIDTTCIESCRHYLSLKLVLMSRYNSFTLKDSGQTLSFKTNPKTNFGIGLSYKGIGVEFQFAPKSFGNNNDDATYGQTQQFSISSAGNGRRFIYDAYIRVSQGFYDKQPYVELIDTARVTRYYKKPDMYNLNLGAEVVYMFNNRRFSSSAPYNFTQRQRKSAGTVLLGSMFSIYSASADSCFIVDSIQKNLPNSLRNLSSAVSIVNGVSFGYTHTFVFGKKRNWFSNFYILPGIGLRQFYFTAINSNEIQSDARISITVPYQYRFAIGVNNKRYFFGFSVMGNNYSLYSSGSGVDFQYKYGVLRFFYGYRFRLKKEYFSKYLD